MRPGMAPAAPRPSPSPAPAPGNARPAAGGGCDQCAAPTPTVGGAAGGSVGRASSAGRRRSASECAKKHTRRVHASPSQQRVVLYLRAARASRGGWVGAREPVGKWEVGRPRTRAHRAAAGRAGCTARQGRAARLTVEEGLKHAVREGARVAALAAAVAATAARAGAELGAVAAGQRAAARDLVGVRAAAGAGGWGGGRDELLRPSLGRWRALPRGGARGGTRARGERTRGTRATRGAASYCRAGS